MTVEEVTKGSNLMIVSMGNKNNPPPIPSKYAKNPTNNPKKVKKAIFGPV